MKELSLHILDITQNSIRAGASLVKVIVDENVHKNKLMIQIEDDGCGICKEKLSDITNPFVTSRTTRKVGLGLSLFKAAAEQSGGHFSINSEINVGTKVEATFVYDHIDRAPLGNMAETIVTMILSFNDANLIYQHRYNDKVFIFSTLEIKEILGDTPGILKEPEILIWIKKTVTEELKDLREE